MRTTRPALVDAAPLEDVGAGAPRHAEGEPDERDRRGGVRLRERDDAGDHRRGSYHGSGNSWDSALQQRRRIALAM